MTNEVKDSCIEEELLRCQGRLHSLLLCLCASTQEVGDLLQQTNLEILRKADKYDASRPSWPWFRKFAVNVVYNWREKRKPGEVFDSTLLERLAEETVLPETPRDPRSEDLDVCLRKLPEWQRRLLEWRHLAGKSLAELSLSLHVSSVSLSKTLWKIRDALRRCITKREKRTIPSGNFLRDM